MNKRKRVFILILSLFLVLASTTRYDVVSKVSATCEAASPYEFAMLQVSNIIAEQDPMCKWTGETQVKNEYVLYDLDDCPNGYIYTLDTSGKETGYIQIIVNADSYSIYSYSFDGTNEVFHLLDASRNEEKSSQIVNDTSQKIYHIRPWGYAIKSEGKLVNLLTRKTIEISKEELKRKYEDQVINKQTTSSNTREITTGSVMVTNYSAFTLVEMDDFEGMYIRGGHTSLVEDHCTPTAGTNVINYFGKCRGRSALCMTYDWMTFRGIYLAMNTNDVNESQEVISGTYWDITYSDGYSGLLNYIESRGVTVLDSTRYALGALTGISLNTIKGKIDDNLPVILTAQSFPGSDDPSEQHSVVAFGYKDNMVILSNGWDKSYHYYTYSGLTIYEYYCVSV